MTNSGILFEFEKIREDELVIKTIQKKTCSLFFPFWYNLDQLLMCKIRTLNQVW